MGVMRFLYGLFFGLSAVCLSCASQISRDAEQPAMNVKLPQGVTGVLKRHQNLTSKWVDPRQVDVWLPPGYMENAERRHPVLYMHDGQNLFDPKTSFVGVDWGIDETLTRLVQEDKVQGAIVVGIWNTPKRLQEYLPQRPFQGKLSHEQKDRLVQKYGLPVVDGYLTFIVEELKPFIDANYRTHPNRDHTFIMGSSMGGLISLYALCEYPEVFSGAGCLSTHWPAVDYIMVQYLRRALPDPSTHKIYFDYGTEALNAQYESYQIKVDAVVNEAGYVEGLNWMTKKFPGDEHSERAWRKRVHIPLTFFLGRGALGSSIREQLIPFEEEGRWGYVNGLGEVVIPPQYMVAGDFSPEGIAAVADENGWAYIDKWGNTVIEPFIFDNGPDYFREGLARLVRDGKFGFFDKTGKPVIAPQFDFASPFSEGMAAVCMGGKSRVVGEHRVWEGGKWGYINSRGELIIPMEFEEARDFENGRAEVKINGEWREIDQQGEIIR